MGKGDWEGCEVPPVINTPSQYPKKDWEVALPGVHVTCSTPGVFLLNANFKKWVTPRSSSSKETLKLLSW